MDKTLIKFGDKGNIVGELYFDDDNKLHYRGNIDESATLFFKFLNDKISNKIKEDIINDKIADLFWYHEDPEYSTRSIEELIEYFDFEVDEIIEIRRAVSLPNIVVKINAICGQYESAGGDSPTLYEIIGTQ